jgi:hypothetical protein
MSLFFNFVYVNHTPLKGIPVVYAIRDSCIPRILFFMKLLPLLPQICRNAFKIRYFMCGSNVAAVAAMTEF